ncbi:MAG: hypothetical protein G01um101433_1081, partial [Parcubacteria group bacterium Gr01-1014_33]
VESDSPLNGLARPVEDADWLRQKEYLSAFFYWARKVDIRG